jgi:hypothetical protein
VDRKKERTALPGEVREAAEYYYNRVEAEDWGSVRVYRVPTDHGETYAVRVTTDGDDGWIEVYDLKGHLLGAGRTYLERIAWAPREEVRQQFGDNWPKALDRGKTRWKPPAPPAPEPRFKPGQAVECRWQYSFIMFPATVTQAELDRVQVEFDDHSREWLPVDFVREGRVRRPSGTENIYKIYAESFKGQAHLDTIVSEAQRIVNNGLTSCPS